MAEKLQEDTEEVAEKMEFEARKTDGVWNQGSACTIYVVLNRGWNNRKKFQLEVEFLVTLSHSIQR